MQAEFEAEQEKLKQLSYLSPAEQKKFADRQSIAFMYMKPPGYDAAQKKNEQVHCVRQLFMFNKMPPGQRKISECIDQSRLKRLLGISSFKTCNEFGLFDLLVSIASGASLLTGLLVRAPVGSGMAKSHISMRQETWSHTGLKSMEEQGCADAEKHLSQDHNGCRGSERDRVQMHIISAMLTCHESATSGTEHFQIAS